jgi:hypothetical protein
MKTSSHLSYSLQACSGTRTIWSLSLAAPRFRLGEGGIAYLIGAVAGTLPKPPVVGNGEVVRLVRHRSHEPLINPVLQSLVAL